LLTLEGTGGFQAELVLPEHYIQMVQIGQSLEVGMLLIPESAQVVQGQLTGYFLVDGGGVVRFRPMMLTAAAVVVGASVILFDPIFQGLAISLMAGEVASLLFSRMTVPILYFMDKRWEADQPAARPGPDCRPGTTAGRGQKSGRYCQMPTECCHGGCRRCELYPVNSP